MTIHSEITPSIINTKCAEVIRNAPIVILDGNLSIDAMTAVMKICVDSAVPGRSTIVKIFQTFFGVFIFEDFYPLFYKVQHTLPKLYNEKLLLPNLKAVGTDSRFDFFMKIF